MLKSQIEQMKEEAEEDQKQFLEEYEELERLIDKDRQVLEFIKAQDEGNQGSKRKEKVDETSDQKKLDNLNELFNTEKLLRKKTCDKAFSIAQEIVNANSQMSQVQQYEEALDEIKEATKLSNSNKLMEEFQKAGEHNKFLHEYVKDVKEEVDNLENEINEMNKEIKVLKGTSEDNN